MSFFLINFALILGNIAVFLNRKSTTLISEYLSFFLVNLKLKSQEMSEFSSL